MKPSVGRIVHTVLDDSNAKLLGGNHDGSWGGLKTAPAVIVRVWTDTCVNLKVFGDSNSDIWVTSVSLDESENPQPRTWHWPPTI